jgi:two-component system invasion response regulator UvrY
MAQSIAGTRFFIVDDHQIVNVGVRVLLTSMGAREIREFTTYADFLAALEEQAPAIAVLDLEMERHLLLPDLADLVARYPDMRVIIYSRHDEPDMVDRVLHTGVWGYVSKVSGLDELDRAVQAVMDGNRYIDEKLAGPLHDFQDNANAVEQLSPKEMEVFLLLVKGLRYKEIADVMGISVNAIGTYRSRIGVKLNVTSVREMERIAQMRNLI